MSTTVAPNLVPPKDSPLSRLRTFTLYYHYRASVPQVLHFEFDGDLRKAKERGLEHCKVMNYRFIKVRPLIVDLDERERRRNDEGFFENTD